MSKKGGNKMNYIPLIDIHKENYENIFQSMLKMTDLEMERKRGNGECQKCYAIFLKEQIEQEFRVTNPITKETKLSILCKKCRKIIGLEMRENIRKRKEVNNDSSTHR